MNSSLMAPKAGYKTSDCTSQLKKYHLQLPCLLILQLDWEAQQMYSSTTAHPSTCQLIRETFLTSPCKLSLPSRLPSSPQPFLNLFSHSRFTVSTRNKLEQRHSNPTAGGRTAPQSPSCWNTPLTQGHSTHCPDLCRKKSTNIKAQILTALLV